MSSPPTILADDTTPWSTNPNAPQISYDLYFQEKANFAGILIASILYGILIVVFFQCIAALLNPARRKGKGFNWGLISYTGVIFSFVTVLIGMQLNLQSISYIDNREFPGVEGVVPSGPLGYQMYIHANVLTIVPDLMYLFCSWLAEGFLIYRCYIMYSRNPAVIAFPCLMFLGSFGSGILLMVRQVSGPSSSLWNAAVSRFNLPYFAISTALSVVLTILIAVRLVLRNRTTPAAPGAPTGINALYKTTITLLIESSALYAANSLLFLVPWVAKNHAADIFLPILGQTQVIAPLLIIQRLAHQSATTSNPVVSVHISSFKARTRGELTASGGLPGGFHVGSGDRHLKTTTELGGDAGVEATIDFHQDKV